MRKKFTVAALAIAVLVAFAAIAQAANEYTISASTNPTKSGTKKRPKPISGTFGFSVRDTENLRPLALDKLTVAFTGMRLNTRNFRTCSAASIEGAGNNDQNCNRAALMAEGFANNIAGQGANRADTSQRCYLTIRLWNSGSAKMTLYVRGQPSPQGTADPKHCPLTIGATIPVSVVRRASGDSISFTIPDSLKNPIGTIRNSLIETRLTLLRKTRRVRGRTVGFFETVGGCRRGRRAINVTFQNEGNNTVRQSGFARCSS